MLTAVLGVTVHDCLEVRMLSFVFRKEIVLPVPARAPVQTSFAKLEQWGFLDREEASLLNCHLLNASS